MKLKFQRELLLGAAGGFAALAAIFGSALWSNETTPEIVRLGAGKASVEAQPIGTFEPERRIEQPAPSPSPSPSASDMGEGHASYYGPGLAGNRTANGEVFDPNKLTAAHRTLPLGSRVRVTNPRNGEVVTVRINDRGPFHGNRVIDLSEAAAREIGLIRSGTARVRLALIVA